MSRKSVTALLSLAATLLTSAAIAQSSVTVYGVADAAAESSRAGNGTVSRVVSGAGVGSRLGFRGQENLGSGVSAVFRIEQGFAFDDGQLGQGGRAWGREASVGLSSNAFGTLQLGRLPTPYYGVLPNVDAFAWMGGGGLLAITRSGPATRQIQPSGVSARMDNALAYSAPNLGGVQLRGLVSLGEGSTTIGRGISASARYSAGPIDAVLGWVTQKGAGSVNGSVDALVVGGSYDFRAARVFAGYTRDRNDCVTCTGALARVTGVTPTGASTFSLLNLGVRVPMGSVTGIAQAVRVKDDSRYATAPGNRDATWFALGAEYIFSRRTVGYASVATIDNANGSQYALGSGSAQQPAGSVGAGNPRATTVTIGIRSSF